MFQTLPVLARVVVAMARPAPAGDYKTDQEPEPRPRTPKQGRSFWCSPGVPPLFSHLIGVPPSLARLPFPGAACFILFEVRPYVFFICVYFLQLQHRHREVEMQHRHRAVGPIAC